MPTPIQLPDKPSEKFPRYFRSTRDKTCLIRFDSPDKCFWIESDHEWAGYSKLNTWKKFVREGLAEEVTEAQSLAALLQNHGL